MTDPQYPYSGPSSKGSFLAAAVVMAVVIVACSVYANLSFAVRDPSARRFFPPFEAGVDANENRHLGEWTEYAHIARSLLAGKGFSDPFGRPTGPTAWMPPLLPGFLAGLLWLSGGSNSFVLWTVVVAQVLVLIATGLLVLALASRMTSRLPPGVVAFIYLVSLLGQFRLAFQWTHDSWLVLLTLDLLIAGLCWLRPLRDWQAASVWGLFGGFCALVNPIVAFVWGVLSLAVAFPERAWGRLGVAVLVSILTLAPWTARNYLVFARWIPVKSNLAYELYQSQCLQPDGLIRQATFSQYPGGAGTREGREYDALGEMGYLDRKGEQFRQAVWADPVDFIDRVAARFLGTTLWYVPFDPVRQARRPWSLWWNRLTYTDAALALLFRLFSGISDRLARIEWIVIGAYLLYLFPYIVVSYYERYGFPLLGLEVLLVTAAVDRLLASRNKRP